MPSHRTHLALCKLPLCSVLWTPSTKGDCNKASRPVYPIGRRFGRVGQSLCSSYFWKTIYRHTSAVSPWVEDKHKLHGRSFGHKLLLLCTVFFTSVADPVFGRYYSAPSINLVNQIRYLCTKIKQIVTCVPCQKIWPKIKTVRTIRSKTSAKILLCIHYMYLSC